MERALHQVLDLVEPEAQGLVGVSVEEARRVVASGDASLVAALSGDFALVGREGEKVRLARSLGRPLRYFLAKSKEGPVLLVATRIDVIARTLRERGWDAQFHPSYTRMVPAHHVLTIDLVGCPDPNPKLTRFFSPPRGLFAADVASLGERYVRALAAEIEGWLPTIGEKEPIGVAFSGGVDSGCVFLVLEHLLRAKNLSPQRLKAFTLSVDGKGEDASQAREFLEQVSKSFYLETIEVPAEALSARDAVAVTEDYKPLDVQAAAVALALFRGIRARYPEWRLVLDGDGGDENFKDYPLEAGGEVTIRSVLSNPLLYHEGWGVDAIKHSLTYSGGLSRGITRSYATARSEGFLGFSPLTRPSVVAAAEGIPFVSLTNWDEEKLYRLKGDVVAAGIEAVLGMKMPVFPKRRFQDGAAALGAASYLPSDERTYRDLHRAVAG